MNVAANVLVGFVAVQHLLFGVLEAFFWTKPVGRKIFKISTEEQEHGAVLAKNQGVYNWFLTAGLVWSFFIVDPTQALHTQTFFLGCVAVAGLVGGITASRTILAVQMLPGLLTLGAVWGAAS